MIKMRVNNLVGAASHLAFPSQLVFTAEVNGSNQSTWQVLTICTHSGSTIAGTSWDASGMKTGDGLSAPERRLHGNIRLTGRAVHGSLRHTEDATIAGWFFDAFGVSHGFVRDRAGASSQIDVAGAPWTIVLAVTNSGKVAGFYGDAVNTEVQHGLVRDPRGRFTTFDVPGATKTQPFGMNEAGVIVGTFIIGAGGERGFVRESSGRVRVVEYRARLPRRRSV